MLTSRSDKPKLVTSQLLDAYLACPTKCYLQSVGESAAENDFAIWSEMRLKSYRLDGLRRLTENNCQHVDGGEIDPNGWKYARWSLAINQTLRTPTFEAHLDAIQRLHSNASGDSPQFAPIRFEPANKLSRSEKLIGAFEALALSRASGTKVTFVKIIHVDERKTFRLQVSSMIRTLTKIIKQVSDLLSNPTSPDLVLNRHCQQCCFQLRCRNKAVEKNDLSLLSNMPEIERARLNSKGIFTVNQLSYTFRPRRRFKRSDTKPERYHHSLKALAIREQTIHVVGDPNLTLGGMAVYMDVEGIPDREFYYLIGLRLETAAGTTQHSLWAEDKPGEECIWRSFLKILSGIERPVLIHYGSFEAAFLKKMCERYGYINEYPALEKTLSTPINLLSVIFAKIYFPTYSNGLKEVAGFIGFKWEDPSLSGIQSIALRHSWESSRNMEIRERLTAYNTQDC